MTDETYCYPPEFTVLRNKFDIRDAATLKRAERRVVANRMAQPPPFGGFDLTHLKAIHRHLFQDVYGWAGETRIVSLEKNGSVFIPPRFIENAMSNVHRRLERDRFLRGRSVDDFAVGAGRIIGSVNYAHPFREGNGRAQLVYLRRLARQAGHDLDLSKLDRHRWIAASIAAQDRNYDPMAKEISFAIAHDRSRTRETGEKDSREAFRKSRQVSRTHEPKERSR